MRADDDLQRLATEQVGTFATGIELQGGNVGVIGAQPLLVLPGDFALARDRVFRELHGRAWSPQSGRGLDVETDMTVITMNIMEQLSDRSARIGTGLDQHALDPEPIGKGDSGNVRVVAAGQESA